MDNKLFITNGLNLEINTFKDNCKIILEELAEDYTNDSRNYLNFNDNSEVTDRVLIKAFGMLKVSESKSITKSTEFLKWINEINELSTENDLFILFDLDTVIEEFRYVYDDFLYLYQEDNCCSSYDSYDSYDSESSW